MVPLHHLGHLFLSASGLNSYIISVPTGSFGNSFLSLLVVAIFDLFADNFSISDSVSFERTSITGSPVLYFLPLRISGWTFI